MIYACIKCGLMLDVIDLILDQFDKEQIKEIIKQLRRKL